MFDLSPDALLYRAMMWVPLVLSLSVHEWAHAYCAYRLGDDTAAMQGRLTLNPVAHIDPLGTFLLPLLGIPFGWARPVPVNPVRFRREISMGTGMMLTAAAGPFSNLVLALLSTLSFGLLWRLAPEWMGRTEAASFLLQSAIQMNVGLALFNLLPIPPLDGSRIVDRVLPYRFRGAWEGLGRFSPFLLMAAMAGGGGLLARPIAAVNGVLFRLLTSVMG